MSCLRAPWQNGYISTLFTAFFVWTSFQFILSFTTLLSVLCGGLKKSPRTCILCCHISPVQISGVVFTVNIMYGPFCHGALKHDISTLFTTFLVWTSLQFILNRYSIAVNLNLPMCLNVSSITKSIIHALVYKAQG